MSAYLQVHYRQSPDDAKFGPGGHVGFSLLTPDGKRDYVELTVFGNLVEAFGSRKAGILVNASEPDGHPRFHHPGYTWQDSKPIDLSENQLLAIRGYVTGMARAASQGELVYQALNLPDTINCVGFVNEALRAAGISHAAPLFDPKGFPDALDKPSLESRFLDLALGASERLSRFGADTPDGADRLTRAKEILLNSDVRAPLDAQTGMTALMAAARLGWDDVAADLIRRGADPRATDTAGRTAEDYAARYSRPAEHNQAHAPTARREVALER